MKTQNWIMIAFLMLLCAAQAAGADQGADMEYEFAIKVSAGNSSLPEYLPKIAERNFMLYLFAGRGTVNTEDFRQLMAQAAELGIKVKLCPSLESSKGGPFPNEDNIDAYAELVHAMLDGLESFGGKVEAVAFNIELGPPGDRDFRQALTDKDFDKLKKMAEDNVDREKFKKSVKRYEALVQEVRARGYRVQITTYSLLLDDMEDRDTDIQDMFNMPMQGISWDTQCFCAYSSEYGYHGHFTVSPYFVYSYAKTARKLYGDNVWLALGLIRNNEQGYTSPDQLAGDIAAAKSAGITKMDLFNFSGMLAYPDYTFDDWADATLAQPEKPAPVEDIDAVRSGMRLADLLLDSID